MIKVFTITPFFSKKKKDGVSNIIENLNYRLKKKVKFYNVKKNTIFNLISYIKKTKYYTHTSPQTLLNPLNINSCYILYRQIDFFSFNYTLFSFIQL